MISPRTFAAAAVAAASLAASPAARAQGQGQSGLISMKIYLPSTDNPDELVQVTNDVELTRFFNEANCECGTEFGVELLLTDATMAPDGNPVEIWVGTNCDDIQLRDMFCKKVTTVADVRDLRNRVIERISVRDLAAPITGVCPSAELNQRVFAIIDTNGDGIPEYTDSIEIFIDTQPPPEPVDINVTSSEAGFNVSWDLGDSRIDDFEFFQVLCYPDGDPTPVFDNPDAPKYETPFTVCGLDTGTQPGLDAGLDGGTGNDFGITDLDPRFICGTQTFGAGSMTVSGLENGVNYRAIWVAVDHSRNATPVDLGTVQPEPLIDWWEDYKGSGGTADGGYCFVATATYGSYDHPYVVVLRDFRDHTLAHFGLGRWFIRTYYALSPPLAHLIAGSRVLRGVSMVLLFPLVVGAAVWEYTGWIAKLGLFVAFLLFLWLRRMRRARRGEEPGEARATSRRRRVVAAAAAGAVIVLAAMGSASAQTYFDELDEGPVTPPGPQDVKWNFELKFGPYVPSVDDEFDGEGPFKRMFGSGPFLISQMALDRYFLWPMGQLGISAGVGYLTHGADAFRVDDAGNIAVDPQTGEPLRADGATTTFRLIPTNLSAVYRFTALDDRYRIPLVPYGRLGLSYYLWWVTRPDGSVARVSTADCNVDTMDCSGNKARGGSLGWQGSIGLAIRAERLDPDAGVSLRNQLGIEHAGMFAELTLAQVDGFGASDKLSVGDLFWAAGINFEF